MVKKKQGTTPPQPISTNELLDRLQKRAKRKLTNLDFEQIERASNAMFVAYESGDTALFAAKKAQIEEMGCRVRYDGDKPVSIIYPPDTE